MKTAVDHQYWLRIIWFTKPTTQSCPAVTFWGGCSLTFSSCGITQLTEGSVPATISEGKVDVSPMPIVKEAFGINDLNIGRGFNPRPTTRRKNHKKTPER